MPSLRPPCRLHDPRHPAPAPLIRKGRICYPYLVETGAAHAFSSLTACMNERRAHRAEVANPPQGAFIEIDGVQLHYLERGEGQVLVMLHGNGSMIQDFVSSGLLDIAAERYRVIVFDRPSFGHSERPCGTVWTDQAQAELICAALTELGVRKAMVFGHSWGCSVAVALALNDPAMVLAMVLASGYHYPGNRTDAGPVSPPSITFIGDAIRHAAAPLIARAMWPFVILKIFGPAPVPSKFDGFPKEMTFRPSQISASAAEAALMIPDASARSARYDELKMPIVIVAGEQDRLVNINEQSGRLHAELPESKFHRVPDAGHMVHQTATICVMKAIDEAATLGSRQELLNRHLSA